MKSTSSKISCPLCLHAYDYNPALAWAPFQCLECGTLIKLPPARGSAEPVGPTRSPSRIDRHFEAVLADELQPAQAARVSRRRMAARPTWLDVAPVITAVAAVAILVVVGTVMLIHRQLSASSAGKLLLPTSPGQLTAPATPAEAKARERQAAWDHVVRIRGEIEANKVETARLLNALRESTSKHFSENQRKLNAARKKTEDLAAEETRWLEHYGRINP